MQKHMLMLGTALMVVVVMIAAWGDWGPLALAAAKKVKPLAPLPQTGQTTFYATGDDGDFQAGVAWPIPRFTDNGDGTVRDNLTGLIWLRNANCFGQQTWDAALEAANALHDTGTPDPLDDCGLADGSVVGDWRLPNRNELTSLLDLGTLHPALPAGHPFMNFVEAFYWSSTTYASVLIQAWEVDFTNGDVDVNGKTDSVFVTAVRGGN